MKRDLLSVVVALILLGWCLQQLEGCMTTPLQSPSRFRLECVYTVGDRLIFVDSQQNLQIYNPQDGIWTQVNSSVATCTNNYAVVGQQLVFVPGRAWNENTVAIIDFSGLEPRERTANHTGKVFAYQTIVAAKDSAVFSAEQSLPTALLILDLNTDTFRQIQSNGDCHLIASTEDTVYCFNQTHSQIYSLGNASWTVIPFSQGIQGQFLRFARFFGETVLLITDLNILQLYVWTGEWVPLLLWQRNFVTTTEAILHRSTLVLITGASLAAADTIFTHDLESHHTFSTPYNALNFVYSSVGYYQNLLYFTTSSTNVLVYDLENTLYSLVHLPDVYPANIYLHSSPQYGDYMVIHSSSYFKNVSSVVMYDLELNTFRSWPRDLRSQVDILSYESYIALVAKQSREILEVDIFNIMTDTWSKTALQIATGEITPFMVHNSVFIAVLGDLHIFNISSSQWRTYKLADTAERYNVFHYKHLVLFVAQEADLSAINLYDTLGQQMVSISLAQTRRYPGIVQAESQLFIAGGSTDNGLLSSIAVLDMNTFTFSYSHSLSEARESPHLAQVGDYIVFVSGRLLTGDVSLTIDILHIPTQLTSNLKFPRPELIRSQQLQAIGGLLYVQTQSALYIINPSRASIQPLLTSNMHAGIPVSIHTYFVSLSIVGNDAFFYFLETTQTQSWAISTPRLMFELSRNPLLVWQTKVITMIGSDIVFFDLPVILNQLEDQILYYPTESQLEVNAVGHNLTYSWQLDGKPIEGATSPGLMLFGNSSAPGTYQATAQDHCRRTISQSAMVYIIGKPQFSSAFDEQMILCGNSSLPFHVFSPEAQDIQWTLNGDILPAHNEDQNEISVSATSLTCGTSSQLCATAINPSGKNSHCQQIHAVNISSVFKGPSQIGQNFVAIGSTVNLHVEILDSRCTGHSWFIDNIQWGSVIYDSKSDKEVEVTQETEKQRFTVIAYCLHNSNLESEVHFIQLSALPLWGLILIVTLGFAILVVITAIVVAFRLRLRRSKKQELELKALLNEAKQETMINKNTLQIIKTQIWEWSPDDSFSFSPLEKLPLSIDMSNLGFSKKNDPVDVDYWVHGTISFTSKYKRKKAGISSFLQQRLLEGHNVEIYAPQSPKFVVKVDQESFNVEDDGSSVTLTVSVLMKMTTKVKIRLMIVLEKEKLYSSIDFSIISKPSPWIDIDDIEMTEQFLGAGGFGTVTRGTYKGLDIAVKMLNNQYLQEHNRIEFEREVSLMKSLHHPNIIQFVGASNVDQSLALVTEYAPLGNLMTVLSQHLIPYKLKLAILIEIARAIQFLHSNNIIHRDIKPLNVLVFSLEPKAPVHVKLTDFGTSKFISEMTATMTKNIGTISYMAPEMLYDPPRLGTSADVYGFAILMWEVITNQEPFVGFNSKYDIEHFIMNGKRFEIPKEVDVKLAQLISECWAHDEAARPAMSVVIQQLSALFNEVSHY